ncbi:MAG: glycosyltransferase [Chloroflexota bacterium]|nr:glycosyltransferase [Chloroflexota bacterium]
MPNTPPILFFTPDPPGAIWQDKPQIARRLARHQPVVFIGPELHLRALGRQRQEGHWQTADLWQPALTPIEDNLYQFHWSPWAAHTGAPGLGNLTESLRRRRWQSTLQQLKTKRPILWLFRPGMLSLIDQFDPQLVIYHVVDEYSAYPNLSAEQAARQRELDRQLTARADLVFCTARSLVEERRPINPQTYYLPNAVDYRAFQRALASPDLSPPWSDLPRPVLGVVGGINAKLDLSLLAQVAQSRPDWSLALVGPVSYGLDPGQLADLKALPNVHLAGAVPHEQVPAIMAACDVCLIPYKINEQTRHVNPLKVYEYLAAGRPVVATPLPELEQFPTVVRLVGDRDSFLAQVESALAEADDPVAMATRRAIAVANTWDVRVARMRELIGGKLVDW